MTLDETIKHAEDTAKQAEEHARYIRYMGRYGWEKECNEYNNQAKQHLQIAEWLKELKSYREMYHVQHQDKFYYSIEPKFADVSKEEFVNFINNYPRTLQRDVFSACDPPSVTYNDFELADKWPYSIVARAFLYDDHPEDYFYEIEERKTYRIMTNYKEVFDSRTRNKAEENYS